MPSKRRRKRHGKGADDSDLSDEDFSEEDFDDEQSRKIVNRRKQREKKRNNNQVLDNTINTLRKTLQEADSIIIKLDNQIDQLNRIDVAMDDINTHLVKSERHIANMKSITTAIINAYRKPDAIQSTQIRAKKVTGGGGWACCGGCGGDGDVKQEFYEKEPRDPNLAGEVEVDDVAVTYDPNDEKYQVQGLPIDVPENVLIPEEFEYFEGLEDLFEQYTDQGEEVLAYYSTRTSSDLATEVGNSYLLTPWRVLPISDKKLKTNVLLYEVLGGAINNKKRGTVELHGNDGPGTYELVIKDNAVREFFAATIERNVKQALMNRLRENDQLDLISDLLDNVLNASKKINRQQNEVGRLVDHENNLVDKQLDHMDRLNDDVRQLTVDG